MTIPGSANPLLLKAPADAAEEGISRSLRFNSSDSAHLSRTPSTAGNRKTWTWAGWVKRSGISQNHDIFSARSGNPTGGLDLGTAIRLRDVNTLQVYDYRNSAYVFQVETSAVYRDPSAWAHIVVAVDTTKATSSDRVRIYINGVEVTSLKTANYPAQDSTPEINSTQQHAIGGSFTDASTSPSFLLNGYLADIHFIDGQALDPTSFGEFDDNGIWQPIAYSGSYGTNGFHLPFSDNSTAAALGTDTSGNGNTWTVNNISVAAGAGNDSVVDVPTNGTETDTGVGGEVRGNYATYNPLDTNASPTNGNLECSHSGFNDAPTTIHISAGKWYIEALCSSVGSTSLCGFTRSSNNGKNHTAVDSFRIVYENPGAVYREGTGIGNTTGLSSFTTNDLIGIAIDITAGTISFYKNGSLVNTTTSSVITNNSWKFYTSGNSGSTWTINFGQRPFAYTAPSGFKALNTANLPTGTITTSGTFTGNVNADGPFVYLNGVPTAMTINGNSVTFATHADKLSNGFKVRTSSSSYNTAGSNTYSVSTTGANFKNARAQSNP